MNMYFGPLHNKELKPGEKFITKYSEAKILDD